MPDGTTLISGTTSFEEFLEAGKDVSFSYTIKADSTGSITLPPATAQYYKLGNQGGKISIKSKSVELKIRTQEEINRAAEAVKAATPPPPPETPALPAPPVTESAPSGNNGVNDPGINKSTVTESPMRIDALIGFMLGCNDANTDNKTTPAYNACKYFKLKTP